MIPDERARCDRFRFGLTQDVKMYLLAADYDDFDVLVARAKDLEQNLSSSIRAGKRPVEGSSVGGAGKRSRDQGTPGYAQ